MRRRLLLLYPPAWRRRYGEEFLAAFDEGPLHVQQVIDIVSGTIDAWLSPDVRRTTMAARVAAGEGGQMKSLIVCEQSHTGVTIRDGLIGALVMLGASVALKIVAAAAQRNGFPETHDVLMNFSFIGPFTLSMPFWLMKGQPWKAQVVIVGGTFALLALIAFF